MSAVSGARMHLCKGLITVSVGTGLATFSIQETTSGGTNAAVLVGTYSASTTGAYPFDFGDRGLTASDTGSRLALVTAVSSAAVFAHATGYVR
jgi:hypothetical protein